MPVRFLRLKSSKRSYTAVATVLMRPGVTIPRLRHWEPCQRPVSLQFRRPVYAGTQPDAAPDRREVVETPYGQKTRAQTEWANVLVEVLASESVFYQNTGPDAAGEPKGRGASCQDEAFLALRLAQSGLVCRPDGELLPKGRYAALR